MIEPAANQFSIHLILEKKASNNLVNQFNKNRNLAHIPARTNRDTIGVSYRWRVKNEIKNRDRLLM
jgi:hypothetical protein